MNTVFVAIGYEHDALDNASTVAYVTTAFCNKKPTSGAEQRSRQKAESSSNDAKHILVS